MIRRLMLAVPLFVCALPTATMAVEQDRSSYHLSAEERVADHLNLMGARSSPQNTYIISPLS